MFDISGESTLRLEVEDTGIGMSLEESSRALEPFFSTQSDGKGLGLVNVLSSVEGCGGALWFKSELNIGTRFVIWIPVAKPNINTKKNSSLRSQKVLNILLVEDDHEGSEIANIQF